MPSSLSAQRRIKSLDRKILEKTGTEQERIRQIRTERYRETLEKDKNRRTKNKSGVRKLRNRKNSFRCPLSPL